MVIKSEILDKIQILEIGIHIVTLIFNMIKLLFIVISVLIINSLLMVSIESKTFEIAVQRMIGLDNKGVIMLIICQSLMYVIPAIILAFAASSFVLGKIADKFFIEYKIQIDRFPSLESSVQAIAIGSMIPLISSIIPI